MSYLSLKLSMLLLAACACCTRVDPVTRVFDSESYVEAAPLRLVSIAR